MVEQARGFAAPSDAGSWGAQSPIRGSGNGLAEQGAKVRWAFSSMNYLSASDWFYVSSDVHTVVARKRQGVRLPLEARSLDRSGPLGQPRVWQAHRPGDCLVRLLGLKSNLLYYCKARMAR